MTLHRMLRSFFIASIAALFVNAMDTKIYAASPNSRPQGSDFPLAEIRSFQMHVTSSEKVVKALGQPFNVFSADGLGPNFSRVLDFQYVYSETGSCYPRKWAHFRFINEILEEYDAFSERSGDSRVDLATRDVSKLIPVGTSRKDVLNAFGTPDFWATSHAYEDQPEQVAYFWVADSKPPISMKRLVVAFDQRGLSRSIPVVDTNVDAKLRWRWICNSAPPVPSPEPPPP